MAEGGETSTLRLPILTAAGLLAALVVVGQLAIDAEGELLRMPLALQAGPPTQASSPLEAMAEQLRYSPPFELERSTTLELHIELPEETPLDRGERILVGVGLVPEGQGEVREVLLELDGGGARERSLRLSAVSPGRYSLRTEAHFAGRGSPPTLTLRASRGGRRPWLLFGAAALILLPLLWQIWRQRRIGREKG